MPQQAVLALVVNHKTRSHTPGGHPSAVREVDVCTGVLLYPKQQ